MADRVNKFSRYQQGYKLIDFAPNNSNLCACGCGVELTGKKKRWASSGCADKVYASFSIIKGNGSAIRKALFTKEYGYCRSCGVYDEEWQADHIIPVQLGGGACDISNFQTLCVMCHKEKTQSQRVGQRATL